MNINKALDYLFWDAKKNGATPKKIEVLKSIVEHKKTTEQQNLQANQTLAKFYISILNQLLTNTFRDSKQCNEIIKDLCQRDINIHLQLLKNTLEVEAIKRVGSEKYPFKESDAYNITKQQQRTENILNDFSDELKKVLTTEIKMDQVIKFVENNINEIIQTEKKELV